MNKFKNTLMLSAAFMILAFFLLGFWAFFYQSRVEIKMLRAMSDHFSISDEPLPVKNVTNFVWDRLCYFHGDSSWNLRSKDSALNISKVLGVDIEFQSWRGLFNNNISYIFARDGKVVAFYVFKKTYITINKNRTYLYPPEVTGALPCLSSDAIFVKKTSVGPFQETLINIVE